MPVAPTGLISLPEKILRDTFGASTTFVGMVGDDEDDTYSPGAAEVLARIHYSTLTALPDDGVEYTLEELHGFRPYILVWTEEQEGLQIEMEGVGGTYGYSHTGTLNAEIWRDTPSAYLALPVDAEMDWKNIVGAIIADLKSLSGSAAYTAIDRLRLLEFRRTHPDEHSTIGDAQVARLSIDWRGV